MISVEEAQDKVLSSEARMRIKEIPILESMGRVLTEDIYSREDIPIYDNSAMDGYAVNSEDVKGADKSYPIRLMLLEEDIPAGVMPLQEIKTGYCAAIMTGAPIPKGCNSVIKKEDTERDGKSILIFKEAWTGENIRYKGEDIKKGDLVLQKGKRVYPGDVGVMASLGVYKVKTFDFPIIGVMATGDELLEIGQNLEPGMVRDSNSYSLAAQIREMGIPYVMYGIVKDNRNILKTRIANALSKCDILLITGGVSMGDYDFVRDILEEIGALQIFWRVNQKPGKPLAFFKFEDKFIFGMPGNPVSVMICFEIYVRPLIRKIIGYRQLFRPVIYAMAKSDMKNKTEMTNFIRVILEKKEDGYYFNTTAVQGSGILTSMSAADGIGVIPDSVELIRAGEKIKVFLLKDDG